MKKKETKRIFRNYEDSLKERLANPEYSQEYLAVALEEYEEDEDIQAFLLALRDVAEAQGGLSKLAERTNLKRPNLNKAFSAQGNPKWKTMTAILHGLGFRLSIESLTEKESLEIKS